MTTLRPPLLVAVRVAVPLASLSFSSTSFAFTVVSAAALVGRHSKAEAAVSISALRNLVMSRLPYVVSTGVLGPDVVSSHSTPQIGSRFPWTPTPSPSGGRPHLYHDLSARCLTFHNRGGQHGWCRTPARVAGGTRPHYLTTYPATRPRCCGCSCPWAGLYTYCSGDWVRLAKGWLDVLPE